MAPKRPDSSHLHVRPAPDLAARFGAGSNLARLGIPADGRLVPREEAERLKKAGLVVIDRTEAD